MLSLAGYAVALERLRFEDGSGFAAAQCGKALPYRVL